ncbi:MAG: cytidine deaminase [Anaerolineaceae bacterium]|jgi:cytidine deaminase|nr:cytidine deaminase [Anaerolineaceae bacterium]MDD4042653.1 cytidine deaminase [Anaerolineaceae bacterium]MDD4577899.1 cytidine deaminase [Anaerolineaceae bacterium]
MKDLTTETKQELIDQACLYQQRAYSPYSHYAVGAAVLAEDGQVYGGANIENSAYPSGLCAERVAIFKAISEGNRQIEAVAVVTSNGGSPCGACRQVMREFAEADMPVILADDQGNVVFESTMDGILPRSFGPEDLEK